MNAYLTGQIISVILDCLMKNLHLELLNQQICKIKNEKLDCETIFSSESVAWATVKDSRMCQGANVTIKLHFLVCSYVTFAVLYVTPVRALVRAFESLLSIPLWVTSQPSIWISAHFYVVCLFFRTQKSGVCLTRLLKVIDIFLDAS